MRQRVTEDMRMRKLKHKTQAAYIRAVRKFAKFLGRSPPFFGLAPGNFEYQKSSLTR
jgi:hypothetical protein